MNTVEDMLKSAFVQNNCRSPQRVTKADGTVMFVRCDSSSSRVCPSCARLRQFDQMRLIGSGCNSSDRDGIAIDSLSQYQFYFVTLTGPSFGPTHFVPKSASASLKRCKCGHVHKSDSGIRGTPINPRTYRYREQVAWNVHVNQLTKATMKRIADDVQFEEHVIVREWQARGVLHLHGIVRVPTWMDQDVVMDALQRLKNVNDSGMTWGRQSDVQAINVDSTGSKVRYMSKVVAYTSKQQGEQDGILCEERSSHYDRLDWHAQRVKCNRRQCDAKSCRGKRHREFGYSGYMMTMSRQWSIAGLTRSKLKDERKQFARERSQTVHQSTLEQAAHYAAQYVKDEVRSALSEVNTVNEQWKTKLVDHFLSDRDVADERPLAMTR